jgi:tRNA:m4X modification enzyme
VAIAKHLCGGATDICLSSLTREDLLNVQPTGLLIAPCCHHSCDLRTYVNVKYLEELGLKQEEMKKLFAATMWANSGAINKKKLEEMKELGIASKERTCMGFVAKRIINIGRLLYMQSKGYEVMLKKYCTLEYSPENLILICHKLSL